MQPAATAHKHLHRDEELRLALVMNGGVSLAVWMGGVALEINRLIGETHPVYEGLLALTRTRARVDVISGASAGGINGAALAMGYVYDTSLYSLRDVWLGTGSLDLLLRNPSESDPPSLLDGDDVFKKALECAFADLANGRNVPGGSAQEMPVDLSLAATRLTGERRVLLDDLGSVIEDLVHRTRFHFDRSATPDPFEKPQELAKKLAKAARTSASFPVAFEPSLCMPDEFEWTIKPNDRQYLIDGGVLDNKPLDHALGAISRMTAYGNVRRVLAYIVPDPSVSTKDEAVPRAGNDRNAPPPMPSLGAVAVASLITIPSAQSVSTQLDAIQDRNAQLNKRRHTLSNLVATTPPEELRRLSRGLFDAYRHRRIDGLIDFLIDQLDATARKTGTSALLGRNTRQWLRALWKQLPTEAPWHGYIPAAYHDLETALAQPGRWDFGLYAIEFMVTVMFDLLRRTQRLQHLIDGAAPVVASADPRATNPPPDGNASATTDWEGLDTSLRNQRWTGAAGQAGRIARDARDAHDDALAALWRRAFALKARMQPDQARSEDPWQAQSMDLLAILQQATSGLREGHPPPPHAEDEARKWLQDRLQGKAGTADDNRRNVEAREQRLLGIAVELGSIIADLRAEIARVQSAGGHLGAGALRADEVFALDELAHYERFVYFGGASADAIIRQLLILEVVHYSISHRETGPDVPLELVQISAQQRSPWGGGSTPAEKLAGMQFAHFGSFYKKSWRANDWMIGRLDGIDRLVRVALNPDRLHRLYGGRRVDVGGRNVSASDYVYDYVHQLAVSGADPSLRPVLARRWIEQAVRDDLRFLDERDARVPDVLTDACDAIVRRLQLEVICRELPEVAKAVSDDIVAGARSDTIGTALARRLGVNESGRAAPARDASPAELVQLFASHRVGSERLGNEAGSDLFTRTISHAVAVMHSAAIGKRSGLGVLGALLKALKLPVYVFYLLANRMSDDSRTAAAVTTSMLIAGIIAVIASAMVSTNASAIATLGWALIAGWFATALLRGGLAAIFGVILVATLVWMEHVDWALLVAGALVLIAALRVVPAWLGAVMLTTIALWWTTGRPDLTSIGATLCDDAPRWLHCVAAPDVATARLFGSLFEVVLMIAAIAALAEWFVARRRGR